MRIGSMSGVVMQAVANLSQVAGKMAESIEKGAVPAPSTEQQVPQQKSQALDINKGNKLDLRG